MVAHACEGVRYCACCAVWRGRRMVALYGHPGNSTLGVLGERGVDATIARAKQVAAAYSGLVSEPVIPAFDLIATVRLVWK